MVRQCRDGLPRIDDGLISFSLEIDLPAGWVAVSQGKRSVPESRAGRSVVRWVERLEAALGRPFVTSNQATLWGHEAS